MTGPIDGARQRSLDAIVFDVVLVGFTATLVIASLGLRPGVGTVPLLVGVPSLAGSIAILVLDLFPNLRPPKIEEEEGGLRSLMAAAKDSEDDLEMGTAPAERRRQLIFSAWALGLVVLATIVSFYWALPIALLAVFAWIRLKWWISLLVIGVTLALFYGLFDVFLGVRF